MGNVLRVTRPDYGSVPLPDGASHDAAAVLRGIHGWAASRPMRDLVDAFGGALPDGDTAALLAWLDAFSAEHWDFRRREAEKRGTSGVERNQVTGFDFAPGTVELVSAVAHALGLAITGPPARRAYDHVVILGGLAERCLQRTAYTAALIKGGLHAGTMAALGSFRELAPYEKDLLGEPADYEFDAMEIGVRRAFGLDEPVSRRDSSGPIGRDSWRVHDYAYGAYGAAGRIEVLAAPAVLGKDRAITADTYRFWTANADVVSGSTVLVVTTPLYVPFQHCDALRILWGQGCAVETIGFDVADIGDAPDDPPPATDRYLQEIRSGIRSMRHLAEHLVAA